MVRYRDIADNPYYLSTDNAPWLLPIKAQTPLKVSDALIDYFKGYGLHLGTNKIRGVVENTMKTALVSGQISADVRDSATRTIGHSPKTRAQFYEPSDRSVVIHNTIYTSNVTSYFKHFRLHDASVSQDAFVSITCPTMARSRRIKELRQIIHKGKKAEIELKHLLGVSIFISNSFLLVRLHHS
jgi:hypothetical protein